MSIEVHPLVWHYFKKGKRLTLYARNNAIAAGWTASHLVGEYHYVGPHDLQRKVKGKPPIIVLYDYDPKTLDALQSCGYRTITPEGFEYK